MTYRVSLVVLALAIGASACGSDSTPTTPTPAAQPKFTAALLPANEVPAIVGAEAAGNGTAAITINTTKDAAGNITAASADFSVTLAGFPAGTTLTGAHIHPGAAGTTGGVIVSLGLASGEIVLTNGGTTFAKNTITVDPALAQAIIANPAGYYFNVHSPSNGGGFARGQLVRAN